MNLARYAPSGQFTGIAVALLLSAGLVYGADRYTHPSPSGAEIASDQAAPTSDATDWESALYASQAANASTSLSAPSTDVVNQFLSAAKSTNLTDTVARSIFVNISSAKSQGLGDDIPTQDQIVAAASSQVASVQGTAKAYAYADLTIIPASPAALRTYGNRVMQSLDAHPAASEQATLLAIDEIVEGGDKSKVSTLAAIGGAYKAIAIDLVKVPVPQTLAPLYLQTINNFLLLSTTYQNMQEVGTDSVRGLAGMQAYENLMDQNARVFTNIAQALNKDGILFTKDEPGSAWGTLLATPAISGSQ